MSHLLGGVFELKAQKKKRFSEDLVEHITMQGSLPTWPVCGEMRNQRPFTLVLVPSTGMDFCNVSLVSHRLRYSPVLLLSVFHCWNKILRLETFQGQHLQSFNTCILKFPPLPHNTALGTRVPTHNPSGHKSIISKPQHGLTSDEMEPPWQSQSSKHNDLVVKFPSFRSPDNCKLVISITSKTGKRLRANRESIENKMMVVTGRSRRDRLEVPATVLPIYTLNKSLYFL